MRIGLTGGIAAGKSTVSARLAELGACVIDYDMLARKVVEPCGAALPRIVETFGGQVLRADGTLDRAWLAEHVFGPFAEPGSRERLDSIEHPLIYREAERLEQTERASRPHAVIVHDIPLLAEVVDALPFRFDHIATVEACDRIRHQASAAQRLAIADTIIDSTQSLEQMFEQVDRLYGQWNEEA